MPPPAVLLVEDEPAIGSLLLAYLERGGFAVRWCRTGREALTALAGPPAPALVILDLGLPDVDGLAVARAAAPAVPVLVVSARGAEPERMAGFDAGVDDYVVKPFSPREVVARAQALLRRAGGAPAPGAPPLRLGPVEIDGGAREVRVDGRAVALTAKEHDLLAHLAAHAGQVLSREALLAAVWGFAAPGQSRTVDQHVAQLRAKLGVPGLIVTVRGLGYRAGEPGA
jgi:DNA-binding response OmpR family regulator